MTEEQDRFQPTMLAREVYRLRQDVEKLRRQRDLARGLARSLAREGEIGRWNALCGEHYWLPNDE